MNISITEWNRDFRLLAAAVASQGIFFGVQMSLFYNFVVTRLGIEPHQLGGVEALREVPGFLNVFFLAAMIRFAPSIIGAVSLVIMGAGIIAYADVTSVAGLALYSFIWSIGFHCWIPLEQSMALSFSPEGAKGKWLGQLRSVHSLAWLATIGVCNLTYDWVGYGGLFLFAGIATMLGGVAVFFTTRKRAAVERGIVLKRRYSLYYLLNFLQGLRKQMFITFAIFALVKVHGMPVESTMRLVFVNQLLITASASWMGHLVDRYGERKMLSFSYVILAFVFFGYGAIDSRPVLYVLYCIDNVIFFGGIALTTYLHKIAPEEEVKPTLSMGVTMNHVAAVASPLIGGYAWHLFGYQVIFFAGSALAVVSLIVCQWIDPQGLLDREREFESKLPAGTVPAS
jgi:predicted MFS family arabinose efflux permease